MQNENRMTWFGMMLVGVLLMLGANFNLARAAEGATGINMSPSVDVPLGPGDMLKISVYGNPDLALETRVSESGTITFPLIGEVAVGGLTPSGAEKLIGGRLQSGGFLKQAQVNILVTQYQGQLVSVLGQVNRPGRYPIDGKRNLTDILALAGGASASGADTVDLIRTRNGKTTKTVVNIVEMMQKGTLNQDLGLMGGDLIFVERAPMFYIYGEVQKPGSYRLEPNMTVLQALSAGGGLTPRGTERNVRIKRQLPDGKLETSRRVTTIWCSRMTWCTSRKVCFDEDASMSFSQFWMIVRARYKLVLGALLVMVLLVLSISLLLPKTYQATNTLVLNYRGTDPLTGQAPPAQVIDNFMATQVNIVKSENAAMKVVAALKLDQQPSSQTAIQRGHRWSGRYPKLAWQAAVARTGRDAGAGKQCAEY